jgi:hypothetical protein
MLGRLSDAATQRWVRATGKSVEWSEFPWLAGPVGDVDVIGTDFFRRHAEREGLTVVSGDGVRGIVSDFSQLSGPTCDLAQLDEGVARFYEETSAYEFDVWSEWSGLFKPFGKALGLIFSRRLQQLNVPLSPLDTKLGIRSEVLHLLDDSGRTVFAAWVRETVATGRALYVGSYSICRVPGFDGACVKVTFPLPNGYAVVIMKPESHEDGSLTVRSSGRRFGDPGFYFYVEQQPGRGWARYVKTLKESIRVYTDPTGVLRADHNLDLWGRRFLNLQYKMSEKGGGASSR